MPTDLKLPELRKLDRDEQNGLILEDGNRILSFRLTTFQALIERLSAMAGDKVAKTILNGLGREIGKTTFEYSRHKLAPENLGEIFDQVVRSRGWGRCLSIQSQPNEPVYAVTMANCPLCYEQEANEPKCDLMRGLVTGLLEAFSHKTARSAVETNCAAIGGKFCIFEITMEHRTPRA